MSTNRKQHPRQEGTPDLRRFLADLSGRVHPMPRKLRDTWCSGQGGGVFRAMARDAYLAKHSRHKEVA